jgi:hemoglobin-like flavoprotein
MTIDQSIQQLLAQRQTVVRFFYDSFLGDYPEVRDYFGAIDLNQQATTLTMALVLVENNFTHGYPATRDYLQLLGHRHHVLGIPTELYPKFCDCLLKTLEGFHGNSWDAQIAGQWRAALQGATRMMLDGYQKPYVY